jgi:RNA polymerase sigma factor (sigma-70 family)
VSLRPFEEIVAAHGPTVLRVCRALLGPADAEDAWSETFLAALRAYPRLRADSNVEAWLVTIAHRKAVDHLRAAARRPIPSDPLPERHQRDGRLTGWEAGLWPALKALPFRQREAVVFHHLVGLTYREIARVAGGSEAAARRAAADGIAALRRSLEGESR